MLFVMSTHDMAQVMEEKGLLFAVYELFVRDVRQRREAGRPAPSKSPIMIYHEKDAQVHVLKCNIGTWPYFRQVEAANPAERLVRRNMVELGETGQADEIRRFHPESLG